MQEEDAANLVKRALSVGGLTQAQLADGAEVHQSTVSRTLAHPDVRRQGKARARLLAYARNALRGETAKGRDKVLTAFESVWDGSEEHASAVARVIDALADFRPSTPK